MGKQKDFKYNLIAITFIRFINVLLNSRKLRLEKVNGVVDNSM
jgi:hypothetical protein